MSIYESEKKKAVPASQEAPPQPSLAGQAKQKPKVAPLEGDESKLALPRRQPFALSGGGGGSSLSSDGQALTPWEELIEQEQARPTALRAADRILARLSGTPTSSPDLGELGRDAPDLSALGTHIGNPTLANLLMGSTRQLSKLPRGKEDLLGNYRMPVVGTDTELSSIRAGIKFAREKGVLSAALAEVQRREGKSLQTLLGERVRDPVARAALLRELPAPISKAQLTRHAFLEHLALGYAHEPTSEAKGSANPKEGAAPEEQGGVSGDILHAFGYTAGDNLSGRWGLGLRVFTPDPKKGKGQPVIIAFRGTEGATASAALQPGVGPFEANKDWIARVVKEAARHGQKVTFVGHSLGGALAQEAAAEFPDLTANVVTFQSPSIPRDRAERVSRYNQAHPEAALSAQHYRVDGDGVPTAGEAALPGQITYFDRVSRPAGSGQPVRLTALSEQVTQAWSQSASRKGLDFKQRLGLMLNSTLPALNASMPMPSGEGFSRAHALPSVSYALGQLADEKDPDPQVAALLKYGLRDPQATPQAKKEASGNPVRGKNGQPTMLPAQEEVSAVFAGQYTTAQDPRLNNEPQRAQVLPLFLAATGAGAEVFQTNIAYNTALSHLYTAAAKASDQKTFEATAQSLLNQEKLSMSPFDLNLARQLNLDVPPRENAKQALDALADLDSVTVVKDGAMASLVAGSLLASLGSSGGSLATEKAQKTYKEYLERFSSEATLEQYRKDRDNPYEVPMNDKLRDHLATGTRLGDLWRMFHPEEK